MQDGSLPRIQKLAVSVSIFIIFYSENQNKHSPWDWVKMNPLSLLASAVINIGLAIIVLSLFSICKKQPSNASIYYARRLSQNHHISFDHSLSIPRFLPSLSWIPRAIRFTEDEILQTSGLDALIVIRLLKFGSVVWLISSSKTPWNLFALNALSCFAVSVSFQFALSLGWWCFSQLISTARLGHGALIPWILLLSLT